MLERSLQHDLRKRSVKQLRAEAARRGLDMRGVVDKADLLRLLEATPPAATTKTMKGAQSLQSRELEEEKEGLAEGQSLEALPTRKLLSEAKRRGISTRGIVDRADLLMLLQPVSETEGFADAAGNKDNNTMLDAMEPDFALGDSKEACAALADEQHGATCRK